MSETSKTIASGAIVGAGLYSMMQLAAFGKIGIFTILFGAAMGAAIAAVSPDIKTVVFE